MRLLVQSPGVTSQATYSLVHAITTVGSSKENDVTILDPAVEEFHAQIINQGGIVSFNAQRGAPKWK